MATRLLDLMGVTFYGPAWSRDAWLEAGEGDILFEAGETGALERYRVRRKFYPGKGPNAPLDYGPAFLSLAGEGVPLDEGALERLVGLPEAFQRRTLLAQRGFAEFLSATPEGRQALLERLVGPALVGDISFLSCLRYSAAPARTGTRDPMAAREELARSLEKLREMERLLDRRAEALRHKEALARSEAELRDLARRRAEWEREKALFAPLQRRLDRGRQALELKDTYEALRRLRQAQEQRKLDQINLKDAIVAARTEFQGAEEAASLMEMEFRDKLVEQKHLVEAAQTALTLDQQVLEHQENAAELKVQLEAAERALKDRSAVLDEERAKAERTAITLREVRKFLQTHAIDERLSVGLPGIQKCFRLFIEARDRSASLKASYAKAIQSKQEAQIALTDRQALFSEASHRFDVLEKDCERARSLFESALKGKTLADWRELCDQSTRRIEALDKLARILSEEGEVQGRLRTLQERRLRAQQETRDLDIKEVEQMGRARELEGEVRKLERRVTLLRRLEDLDALRELLQDGVPCPICGSVGHPYVSGLQPDDAQAHQQFLDAQRALDELREQLRSRQARAGHLSDEIASIERGEEEAQRDLARLADVITEASMELGLRFGAGVPPMEELDRARQKAREQLQRARSTLDAAEAAEHDLKALTDELERMRENRAELTRYHQEALFQLKAERTRENRMEDETRSQEEVLGTIRRELIAQLSLYGYKNIPDDNPAAIVQELERRAKEWREGEERKDTLERETVVAQTFLANLKKELGEIKLRRDALANQIKALESDGNGLRQQRLILFQDRDPKREIQRMEDEMKTLRAQIEARNRAKAESAARLQSLQGSLHSTETAMAMGRDRLQKEEIAFGKQLLASGFKNEDDFISVDLAEEERRNLQARLKALTQRDLDLTAAYENAMALRSERQAHQEEPVSLGGEAAFVRDLLELNRKAGELYLSLGEDPEARSYREFASSLRPRLRDLKLGWGDRESRAQIANLILNALIEGANLRLAEGGEGLRLQSPGALEVLESGEGGLPLAALGLAWGLADLFGSASPRLWDAGALPNPSQAAGWVQRLRRDGERVFRLDDGHE